MSSAVASPKVTVPFRFVAPVTAKSLSMVVVPVASPIETVVASPPISKVVALVLNTDAVPTEVVVKFPAVETKSPVAVMLPEQVRSPVVPSKVQPVSAEPPENAIEPEAPAGPTINVVAAPPILSVVAPVSNKVAVGDVVVKFPPFAATSFATMFPLESK